MERIGICKKCELYKNQKPLLQNKVSADVIWIGLSAVKVSDTSNETPLGVNTKSGQLIETIEKTNPDVQYYKTNLVKCLPLKNGKMRYPSKEEMNGCYENLLKEIEDIKPKKVFLLGKQVCDFIKTKAKANFEIQKLDDNFKYEPFCFLGTTFIPIHHPSYVLIYKHKNIHQYINAISSIIVS